jgi:penicillin-binding protein 2
MREVVTRGTASPSANPAFPPLGYVTEGGKTGTAEYCDDVARKADQCDFGKWPTHSWTLAYAPYEDPEIIVLAFAYHGGEGASVAAPIVSRVIRAYFELKAIDIAQGNPAPGP